ncbi:hypothetical protein ABZV78_24050 [Micromonospora sp. NPDC004540]|uniref:hypothetical protein n=1 Tax=Micromonospora sp. NPDC004540 TaxID=3154457 RepID=UPI0033A757E0
MLGFVPLPHAWVPVSAVPPVQVIDELGPLVVVRQPQSTIVVARSQHGTTVGLDSQGDFIVARIRRTSGQVREVDVAVVELGVAVVHPVKPLIHQRQGPRFHTSLP